MTTPQKEQQLRNKQLTDNKIYNAWYTHFKSMGYPEDRACRLARRQLLEHIIPPTLEAPGLCPTDKNPPKWRKKKAGTSRVVPGNALKLFADHQAKIDALIKNESES